MFYSPVSDFIRHNTQHRERKMFTYIAQNPDCYRIYVILEKISKKFVKPIAIISKIW